MNRRSFFGMLAACVPGATMLCRPGMVGEVILPGFRECGFIAPPERIILGDGAEVELMMPLSISEELLRDSSISLADWLRKGTNGLG